MSFNPNIPQPTDRLVNSQSQFLANNQSLDNGFGQDHYAFSNLTPNRGKHNNIRTPIITGSAHPTTPANENAFYSMQDIAAIGLLQYSRGVSDMPPTPVTKLQSTNAGTTLNINVNNILDFTGLSRAVFHFILTTNGGSPATDRLIMYTPGNFTNLPATIATNVVLGFSGNILTINNTTGAPINNVFYTFDFIRLVV